MKQTFISSNQIKLGDIAPDIKLVDKDVKDFSLSDLKAKTKVILTVPSIDTGVCDIQATRFAEKLAGHDDIDLALISLDLPFAQDRWCGAKSINNIKMLSDYKYCQAAEKWGLKLEGLSLLGRSVIILDETNKITYIEICQNVPDHPDYDAAFASLNL